MFNLFNLALCGNVKWKVTGPESWLFWSLVSAILVFTIGAIIVSCTKKDKLGVYTKWGLVAVAVFSTGCLIAKLYLEMSEIDYKEQIYAVYFLVCSILLICAGLVVAITNMVAKENDLAKKIAKIVGLLLLLASLGMFIAGMVSVEDLGYIDSKEIFATMGKGARVTVTLFTILVFLGMSAYALWPNKNKKTNETLAIVYGGVSIAMSFALSYAKIFKLPAGGSITVASLLPLALYSYMFGTKKGVMAGLIYGTLQIMQDPWIVHPTQVFLDYVLAFGMIGFSGMFRNMKIKPLGFALGTFIASALRWFCHFLSGGLFFFGYIAKDFANKGFTPFGWAAFYNCFVFVDILIVLVVGTFLMSSKQVAKMTSDVTNRYLNA